MTVFIIIFCILAACLSLFSMGYVTADVIIEKRRLAQVKKEVTEPEPEPEPEPESEPEPMIEVMESVEAEEVDEILSDEVALGRVLYEKGARHGYRTSVNIGAICASFPAGAVVTLAELKNRGLAEKNAKRLKILAGGSMNKPLTVKAESFSVQAIKMVELTGGTAIVLTD